MRYDLSGKVALVTGATGGIGAEIAKGLAMLGAQIFLHGRDAKKVEDACAALPQMRNVKPHQGVVADFSSLAAVSKLADTVTQQAEKLDILVNNAGIWVPERHLSTEGHELQFAVNYLAPFLLTERLRPLLADAGGAKTINLASAMHLRGSLNFNDLMFEHHRYSGIDAYAQSKLALVMATREWAKRVPAQDISFFAVHPGIVRTNIAGTSGWQSMMFNAFGLFYLTPREGARTPIYLAAEPNLQHLSGHYFREYEKSRVHKLVDDADARTRLWTLSEALCCHITTC